MINTRQVVMYQVAADKWYQTGVRWQHAGVRWQVIAWQLISIEDITIQENSADTRDQYAYRKTVPI